MSSNRFASVITMPELPGAIFNSHAALREFCHQALEIERIISEYERYRDEFALAVDLEPYGFNAAEIAEIVARPSERPRIMYVA